MLAGFVLGFVFLLSITACGRSDAGSSGQVDQTAVAQLVETELASQQPTETQSSSKQPEGPPNMLSYTNTSYGFECRYPETWTAEEADHAVIFRYGNFILKVNFRFVDEAGVPPMFGRTGVGAGEFVEDGSVDFLGQALPIRRLVGENKVKAVFYQLGETTLNNEIFMITLEAVGIENYRDVDIPEAIQVDALSILESFEQK
jgi:hypothetical protein